MLAQSAFALNRAGEFNAWATAVSLDPSVRENVPLPPDLQGLLDKSRRYPLWVNNQNAQQYAHLRRFHPEIDAESISTLVTAIQCRSPSNSTHYEIDPDARLSSDVERALPHIFFIPRHRKSVRRAEVVLPDIHQANLRAPLDRLLSHVWLSDDLYDNRFVHILECSLKMPDAKVHHTFDTSIASAVTFICDRDPGHTLDFSHDLKEYLTCTSQVPHYLALAHWITQYKRSKKQTEPELERQTVFGMVSGIWQRRSLGFSQHWVFGMMHFGDNVHVLAGRWEDDQPNLCDNALSTINSVALDPSFNEHPTSSAPYLRTENAGKNGTIISQRGSSEISATPMSLENSPSAGNSRSGSEDDERTPAKGGLRGTSKGQRIVIYRVAKYTTASALSMLELYLILRASRQLGLTYRSEIFNEDIWEMFASLDSGPIPRWFAYRRNPTGAATGYRFDIPEQNPICDLPRESENVTDASIAHSSGALRDATEHSLPERREGAHDSCLKLIRGNLGTFSFHEKIESYLDRLPNPK